MTVVVFLQNTYLLLDNSRTIIVLKMHKSSNPKTTSDVGNVNQIIANKQYIRMYAKAGEECMDKYPFPQQKFHELLMRLCYHGAESKLYVHNMTNCSDLKTLTTICSIDLYIVVKNA